MAPEGRRALARLLPVLVVLLAYFSFATDARLQMGYLALDAGPKEGYQYLAAGFRHGQLGLDLKPSAGLLALPDPYDPGCHAGLAPFDTAYYKGSFYLMHGPLPVLAVYGPLLALSGRYANGRLATLLLGSFGFLCLYGSLIFIKDRYFPQGEEAYVLLGGLSLGLGNLVPSLLSGVSCFEGAGRSFYFSACAAGMAATALGALGVLRAFGGSRVSARWLALASFGFAAAAAARPGSTVNCLAFLAIVSVRLTRLREERRLLWAAWLPALFWGALLALYNFGRFDDPLNFGLGYQLNAWRMQGARFFGVATWASNAQAYFLQAPRFLRYFPFVSGSSSELAPAGWQVYHEELIGFLALWPAGLLLLGLPWSLRRWSGRGPEREGLRWSAAVIAGVALAALLLLCSLSAVTYRYLSDLAPLLLLLLVLQAWLLQDLDLPRPGAVLLSAFFLLSSVWGIVLSVAYAFWGYRGSYLQVLPRTLVGLHWG